MSTPTTTAPTAPTLIPAYALPVLQESIDCGDTILAQNSLPDNTYRAWIASAMHALTLAFGASSSMVLSFGKTYATDVEIAGAQNLAAREKIRRRDVENRVEALRMYRSQLATLLRVSADGVSGTRVRAALDWQRRLFDLRDQISALSPPSGPGEWDEFAGRIAGTHEVIRERFATPLAELQRVTTEPQWEYTNPNYRPPFPRNAFDRGRFPSEREPLTEKNDQLGIAAKAAILTFLDGLIDEVTTLCFGPLHALAASGDHAASTRPRLPVDIARLRGELVRFCDDPKTIRMFTDDAGLNASNVDLTGPAESMWHAIIIEAQRQGRLDDLAVVVKTKYPRFLVE